MDSRFGESLSIHPRECQFVPRLCGIKAPPLGGIDLPLQFDAQFHRSIMKGGPQVGQFDRISAGIQKALNLPPEDLANDQSEIHKKTDCVAWMQRARCTVRATLKTRAVDDSLVFLKEKTTTCSGIEARRGKTFARRRRRGLQCLRGVLR
jgi:hypothetical protein